MILNTCFLFMLGFRVRCETIISGTDTKFYFIKLLEDNNIKSGKERTTSLRMKKTKWSGIQPLS